MTKLKPHIERRFCVVGLCTHIHYGSQFSLMYKRSTIAWHSPNRYSIAPNFPRSFSFTSSSGASLQFLSLNILDTHRPPLHHDTHNLKERVCRRHRSMLSICIICRRHLDNIRRDKVNAFETTDDRAEFAGGPSAGFGGAGRRGNYRRAMSARRPKDNSVGVLTHRRDPKYQYQCLGILASLSPLYRESS